MQLAIAKDCVIKFEGRVIKLVELSKVVADLAADKLSEVSQKIPVSMSFHLVGEMDNKSRQKLNKWLSAYDNLRQEALRFSNFMNKKYKYQAPPILKPPALLNKTALEIFKENRKMKRKGESPVHNISKEYSGKHDKKVVQRISKMIDDDTIAFMEKKPVLKDGTYHVLTVKQPWAKLLVGEAGHVIGPKDIENRTWGTNLSNIKLLIHAGKKDAREKRQSLKDILTEKQYNSLDWEFRDLLDNRDKLEYGAIIGEVELGRITHDNNRSIWAEPGVLHWEMKKRQAYKKPIKDVKGKLRVWEVIIKDGKVEPVEKATKTDNDKNTGKHCGSCCCDSDMQRSS